MHIATEQGHAATMVVLLDARADVDAQVADVGRGSGSSGEESDDGSKGSDEEDGDWEPRGKRQYDANVGDTCLHLAAAKGRIEVAEVLLERGARLDPKNTKGWTAIRVAKKTRQRAMVDFLLTVQ